jgi:ribosome-binding factor A
MAEVKRSARVGGRMREELAALLGRSVRDPRVAGVVLTDVVVTDDLQLARVRVRLADRDGDPAARRSLIAGLVSASGMLRREVAQRLGLRYAPRLEFHYDDGLDQRGRIDTILSEIELESRARRASASQGEDEGESEGESDGGARSETADIDDKREGER